MPAKADVEGQRRFYDSVLHPLMEKATADELSLLFMDASHFVPKKVLTVANDTYITATEVCEMLRKVAAAYPDRVVHIVLDNARYQKCEAVRTLAENLGITLQYIPPKPELDRAAVEVRKGRTAHKVL
ncbi:MAG: hypothetical protein HFH80_10960 [Lachnospiraceae bacterium]|nr:hypothetical protein [Lachnospiraceae bacterium]